MNKTIDTTYEKALQHVMENGVHKEDRTGTGTKSVFGYQMRFDLQNGFPLVTTKKVHMKSIIHELLWFLQGNGNIQYLKDNNVKIWDAWANENNELGPVYGAIWRYAPSETYNEIVKIERRVDKFEDYIYPSNAESSRYEKIISGVGFLGEPVKASASVYDLWYDMLARCYDKEHPDYEFYGERGVKVSPIWHSFEMFVKTLSLVPLHHLWEHSSEGYYLDKDYFGSGVYSPSTTIFLPQSVNKRISSDGSALKIKDTLYSDWSHFETLNNQRSDYSKSRLEKGYAHKDYSPEDIEVVESTSDFMWRPKVYIDQIAEVIEQIKMNPDSRRLIVSAWNPAALPHQALPPCHAFFQFYVANGKLSCQLYQRSGDLFLGVPFNIASYVILLSMIAQQTGLEVGEFVHTLGDAHIYDNHVEQVELQLSRVPEAYPFPELKILRKPESIDDYRFEDFEVVGYEHHPLIRGAVAV